MTASYASQSFHMEGMDQDGYQPRFSAEQDGGVVVRRFIGTSGAIDVQAVTTAPQHWVTPIYVEDDTTIPALQAVAKEMPRVARTLTDEAGTTYSNVYLLRVFDEKRQPYAQRWTASVEWLRAAP